jgi:nicotinamidase-related amidase
MPLTQLDPVAALTSIDLQKGIIAMLTAPNPAEEIIGRVAKLTRAFRRRSWPVVLVNVTEVPPGRTDAGRPKFARPDGWADLVPELEQQPGDHVVTKKSPGAFSGTSLDEHLHERGATQIFLTGISTSIGVESTARAAYDLAAVRS